MGEEIAAFWSAGPRSLGALRAASASVESVDALSLVAQLPSSVAVSPRGAPSALDAARTDPRTVPVSTPCSAIHGSRPPARRRSATRGAASTLSCATLL